MSNGILFNCCNAVMGWCCHGTVAANGEHCDMVMLVVGSIHGISLFIDDSMVVYIYFSLNPTLVGAMRWTAFYMAL